MVQDLSYQKSESILASLMTDNRDPLPVYAVYATEIDCLEGETPLEWMLLTSEVVEDLETAIKILRWYTYRWRVEDFHKIFKSGCQCELYRLAAEGMKTLLGFLSVCAVELLQVTYLHRNQPDAPVESTIKQIGFRVKLAGASWSQRNVPKILRLRTAFLNNSPSLSIST